MSEIINVYEPIPLIKLDEILGDFMILCLWQIEDNLDEDV